MVRPERIDNQNEKFFLFHFLRLWGLYPSTMTLTRRVIIFVFLVSWGLPAGAAGRPSFADQRKRAAEGRELFLARDTRGAESLLNKIVQDWPEELLGVFGFMAFYQVRNLENLDFRFDPLYRPWEEKGRRTALQVINNPDAGPWDLLVAGGTIGISGFSHARHSRWFPALRDGLKAVQAMRRGLMRGGLEKDPGTIDHLLGIGLYDYWRSVYTRRLRFLPFFPDRRETGRSELMQVVQSADFSRTLAEIALAFIDFQEKRYPPLLETTGRLLATYPNNTILRLLQGQALLALKRYPEAVVEFEKILGVDPAITKSYLFLGIAYAGQKETEKARAAFKKFLDLEPNAPPGWKRQAVGRLSR